MDPAVERQPLLSGATHAHYDTTNTLPRPTQLPTESKPSMMRITTPWLALAAASGACAAFNGVFAKLWGNPLLSTYLRKRRADPPLLVIIFSTTTDLTSSWASAISAGLGLASTNKAVEFVIRAVRLVPFVLRCHIISNRNPRILIILSVLHVRHSSP